jgi:hypothetical protein
MKTKSLVIKTILFSLGGLIWNFSLDAQPTGKEIVQMVHDQPDGENSRSVMTMQLVNHRGAIRERTLLSYSLDVGEDSKSIMFFESPADVKGTGFLSWQYDNPDQDDDRWLYLPAMKKVRRISGASAKKENFMGSDFTYDDMGGRSVDEDQHQLLREEDFDGSACWVVEHTPLNDDATYSKRISWIRKDALTTLKVEFYDRMGALLKTLRASEIVKQGNYWTTRKLEMTNHQRNHKTLITLDRIEYDLAMDESMFTVPTLERGLLN